MVMGQKTFSHHHRHHIRLFFAAIIIMIGSGGYLLYQKSTPQNKNKTTDQSPPTTASTTLGNKQVNLKPTVQLTPEKLPTEKKVDSEPAAPSTLQQTQSPPPLDGTHATMVIDGQTYPVFVVAYSSVYDALYKLNLDNKIKVEFKNYSGLGYFVDSINGKGSDKLHGKYWIYYINGVKAQTGISSYILKLNDVITWKYENQE